MIASNISFTITTLMNTLTCKHYHNSECCLLLLHIHEV